MYKKEKKDERRQNEERDETKRQKKGEVNYIHIIISLIIINS